MLLRLIHEITKIMEDRKRNWNNMNNKYLNISIDI